MKMTDILRERFPHLRIPKRRSEKVKMRILRKNLVSKGLSLIRKEVYDRLPKDGGLFCRKFGFSPASYQTSAGKRMQDGIIKQLQNDPEIKDTNNKIGNKDIEILILYHLVKTKKKRDIDNYNKNIIDSLHKGGLFKDDIQVKFLASKIEFIEVRDKSYYRALEAATVRLDFFNENSEVCTSFNEIFMRGDSLNENK